MKENAKAGRGNDLPGLTPRKPALILIPKCTPDFEVTFHDTFTLFHPQTHAAREWIRQYCPAGDSHKHYLGSLVVEPLYVEQLAQRARKYGLLVDLKDPEHDGIFGGVE